MCLNHPILWAFVQIPKWGLLRLSFYSLLLPTRLYESAWLPPERFSRKLILGAISTGQLKCDGTRAENRFRLWAKRTSPFKSAVASVQSTVGSRGVRISGSNARYIMFRGSVKSTGCPLHSSVSPSLPLPCVTVCHHVSTALYNCWETPDTFTMGQISGTFLEDPKDFCMFGTEKCRATMKRTHCSTMSPHSIVVTLLRGTCEPQQYKGKASLRFHDWDDCAKGPRYHFARTLWTASCYANLKP